MLTHHSLFHQNLSLNNANNTQTHKHTTSTTTDPPKEEQGERSDDWDDVYGSLRPRHAESEDMRDALWATGERYIHIRCDVIEGWMKRDGGERG